ncbi:MAG: di-heme oxidoredictase family protein [Acidimicrobiia bacterium]
MLSRPSRVLVPAAGRSWLVAIALAVLVAGCYGGEGYSDYATGPGAPGGDGTVSNYGPGAFSQAAANLSQDEIARFRIGDRFFTQPWSSAPGEAPESDGLGPTYLATSCAACHPADGRSSAPASADGEGSPILRFVDATGAGSDLDDYHHQLQTDAVDGVPPEGVLTITWEEVEVTYPDGSPISLRRPVIGAEGAFGELGGALASGVRVGPSLIGLGLLEAIPQGDVMDGADPSDDDGDGISGRVPMVLPLSGGDEVLGRFGLKGNVASVADQTAIAYLLDMGITSPLLPDENCPVVQVDCANAPAGGSPEISEQRFADVVFYTQSLAVPGRPFAADESIVAGQRIFEDIGCAGCHVPKWVTGDHEVSAFVGQTIYPYTDLLLHDMGEGLSDGRADGSASATEWQTPALWGLGLTRTVNADAGFLHDGRARNVEEAVLWHGGEAGAATRAFTELSESDRELVLNFLKSL